MVQQAGQVAPSERGLDPESEEEWAALRRAALRVLDHVLAQHRGLRDAPCFRAPSPEARAGLSLPPGPGIGIEAAVERALSWVAPYGTGNLSPRFWGWVLGGGNLPALVGQLLATGMNANVFAGDQAPVLLEQQVVGWFRDWFEMPTTAAGLLLEGASLANVLGLAVARHHATGGAVREEGAAACSGLRLYCSTATHMSVFKAAELLGLGRRAVRLVETDAADRIALGALEQALADDRRRGERPFCVVANAGTVGTGAIDPLLALQQLCRQHGCWLHVDGAVGALGYLSPSLRPLLSGLPLADSLAFDLHKWGQVPYGAGCLLVRDGALQRAAFEAPAAYLSTLSGGVTPHGSHAFSAYGPLLSREDRALKVWMTLEALGVERLSQVLEQSVRQARALADCISREPELELLNEVTLNIVCFRVRHDGLSAAEADTLHEHILVELQQSGFCVLTPHRIAGRTCLRAALSNHRTRLADVLSLVPHVLSLARSWRHSQ